MQCRGIEPHFPARGMSHTISRVVAKPGVYICELQRGWPFETPFCSSKTGHLLSYEGHLRNLNLAWQDNSDTSGGEVGEEGSLSSFHRDIGISINFQEDSRLVSF